MSGNYFEEADDGRNWRRKTFEALLAHPTITLRQRRVAMVIIKRADENEWCAYPGVRRIAYDCGFDRKDVTKILKRICVDDGALLYPKDRPFAIFIREPGGAGRGNSAAYHLRWEWVEETLAPFEKRYEAALPEEVKRGVNPRPLNRTGTSDVKGGKTRLNGGKIALKGGDTPSKRPGIYPPESLESLESIESTMGADREENQEIIKAKEKGQEEAVQPVSNGKAVEPAPPAASQRPLTDVERTIARDKAKAEARNARNLAKWKLDHPDKAGEQ